MVFWLFWGIYLGFSQCLLWFMIYFLSTISILFFFTDKFVDSYFIQTISIVNTYRNIFALTPKELNFIWLTKFCLLRSLFTSRSLYIISRFIAKNLERLKGSHISYSNSAISCNDILSWFLGWSNWWLKYFRALICTIFAFFCTTFWTSCGFGQGYHFLVGYGYFVVKTAIPSPFSA